jgi:hypothetical protein
MTSQKFLSSLNDIADARPAAGHSKRRHKRLVMGNLAAGTQGLCPPELETSLTHRAVLKGEAIGTH